MQSIYGIVKVTVHFMQSIYGIVKAKISSVLLNFLDIVAREESVLPVHPASPPTRGVYTETKQQ
jgi:hypothetical protein